MKHIVQFSYTAKVNLHEIAIYIAKQSGSVEIANNFISGIQEKCKLLEEFPLMGSFPKDHFLRAMGYRFVSYKDYLICYKVLDEKQSIHILTIFSAKKDYPRVLKNLF